jgi:transposase
MIYVALDLHNRNTTVAIHDDLLMHEALRPRSVPTDQIVEYLSRFPLDQVRVALEAGGSRSISIAQQLFECGFDVLVVDPFRAHRMLEGLATAKSDRLDAEGLLVLLVKGMLEHIRVWIPDQYTARLRELTRGRRHLVQDAARVRNRIRKFIARQGRVCKYSDLMGKGAQSWLAELSVQLPPELAVQLSGMIAQLRCICEQIAMYNTVIEQMVKDNPMVTLLRTIPGIGPVLSAAIAAEIGTITRFKAARFLRGYSGLVPINEQSGERSSTGHLRLRGNSHLRWALIQAAMGLANNSAAQDLSLRKWHSKQVYTHGPNPARVALARRLCNIIFAMLRDGTEFDIERYLDTAA